MELTPRILTPPRGSFFLFGPRGTGKSTWTEEVLSEALRVDLLQPDTYRTLAARPERLRELVHGNPGKTTIVVDEVQKIPELLDSVHALIEENKRRRFVLTGSSARKLKRAGVDLLAGRVVRRTMHPFIAAELGARFDLTSALRLGTIPLVRAAVDPADTLRSYVSLYVREEVQSEGLVRNVGAFARFLEAISFAHGSVLNLSNVARECEVERKTVESYVGILEDLLLSFRLPVFRRRAKRAVTTHPKFFLFDPGVYRVLRPHGPLDRADEIDGCALEGLVATHLRAWIDYSGTDSSLCFWRTPSGTEVDFVVYGDAGFYAIEVKNADRVRREDSAGLLAFRHDYPQSRAILAYRGSQRLAVDGVLCMSVDELLRRMIPGEPLPD